MSGRCKDCRYWGWLAMPEGKLVVHAGTNPCQLEGKEGARFAAQSDEDAYPYLLTDDDFGCVQFAPREEDER